MQEKLHNNKEITKVAYLGNQITFGGGATSFYLLIKSLDSGLFDKYVYTSSIRSPEMIEYFLKHCNSVQKIKIKEVKSSQTSLTHSRGFFLAKIRIRKEASKLAREITKNGATILHVNNSVFSHVYKHIGKHSNIKIVTHVREMILSNENKKIAKHIIRNIIDYSDAIITISDNEAKPFKEHDNLYIIPNPFDFTNVLDLQSSFREYQKLGEDHVLVGMIGRFSKSKGHMFLLKALREIKISKLADYPFKFVLVGVTNSKSSFRQLLKRLILRKDLKQEIIKYIESHNLINDIILVPYTQDIFNVIKSMDIIVRPSLFGDPWGRDIIESMALRKPIVATGTSEFFIKDGINGFLVGNDNILFAKRIAQLINSKDLRNRMGTKNFVDIKGHCDLQYYGQKIENVYRTI